MYHKNMNKYITFLIILFGLKPNMSYLLGNELGFWIPEIICWIAIFLIIMKIKTFKINKDINVYCLIAIISINLLAITIGLFKFNNANVLDFLEVFRAIIYFLIYIILKNSEVSSFVIAKSVIIVNIVNFFIGLSQLLDLPTKNILKYIYKINIGVSMDSSYKRIGGTLGNPNYLGIWSVFTIFLIIKYYKGNKIKKSLIVLISFINLIFTVSRTALILLGLGIIVYMLIQLKYKISLKRIVRLNVIFFGFILCTYFFINNANNIGRIGELMQDLSTFNNRTEVWKIALDALAENYMFGVGIAKNSITTFDNNFIEIFVRYGLLGFSIYSLFFANNLLKALKRRWIDIIINILFIISMLVTSTYRVTPLVIIYMIIISDSVREVKEVDICDNNN